MNYLLLGHLAYAARATAEDFEPILLSPEGSRYRLRDGRHRFVACLIAGRAEVLAVVE